MDQTLTSLDKSLSTLINGATEKGTKLVDFLYEQAPEVIAQLLLWHGVESFIMFTSCLLLVVIGAFVNIKLVNKYKNSCGENWSSDEGFWWLSILTSAVIQFIVLITAFSNTNLIWLKIWIAPKVYLLEYVANLTK